MIITDLFKGKSPIPKDKDKLSSFLSEAKLKDQVKKKDFSKIPSFEKVIISKEVEVGNNRGEESFRTLFIGNLPLECAIDKKEQERFKKWFFNESSIMLESIRFRKLIVYKSGKILPRPDMLLLRKSSKLREKVLEENANGSVNAYIVLRKEFDISGLDSVIGKLNGNIYLGRHLRVDRADVPSIPSHKKTIFLGNLPPDLQDEDLWLAFEKLPLKVTSVRLVRDKKANVGKGIAFVTFSERVMVKQSIDLFKKDPLVIKNRIARVSKCNNIKK
jgi:nucleolar protein 12